jgi:hypothetical protein
MTLARFGAAPIVKKVEGTSQTYGQLIVIPSKQEASSLNKVGNTLNQVSQVATVAPQDTIVKIVPNEATGLGTGVVVHDSDKSKISVAAFSDNKQPTVALNKESSIVEAMLEGANLNTFATIIKNDVQHAIVIGSLLKPKEEIKKILTEAQKVDMMISMKSKFSEDLEFNNLKEPELSAEFVYNFFSPDEADVISQEDQSQDPYLKNDIFHVPRYVELRWPAAGVTEELSAEETAGDKNALQIKKEAFGKKRGVTGFNSAAFKNSFEKSKKKLNLLEKEGVKKEIVDMHKLDVAFDATANKKMFGNTISAVFNIGEQPNVIANLPINFKK